MRFLLLSLLLFLLACTSDAPASTDVDDTANAVSAEDIVPPPVACVYLTEATVLSYFPAGVRIPTSPGPAASEHPSCQYTLEAADWSGSLLVEMAAKGNERAFANQLKRAATAGGDFAVGSGRGVFTNGGRVLTVSGGNHFRLSFTALPHEGSEQPYDEAARRDILRQLAAGIVTE